MAAELVQDTGERGPGFARHTAQPPDTDGRGEQQARIQDEQRLLEPGPRAAPEHGPEPIEFQSKLARTRFHELDTRSLALSAEQREPKPRHHARSYGAPATADATAAAAEHAAGSQSVERVFEPVRGPAANQPAAKLDATAAKQSATAAAKSATAAKPAAAAPDGEPQRAGARSCAGATAAATRAAHVTAAAVKRTKFPGQDDGKVRQRVTSKWVLIFLRWVSLCAKRAL